jgi:hypothetical protein
MSLKKIQGKLGSNWKDNIKTDLKEIMWKCVNWIPLFQGRMQ